MPSRVLVVADAHLGQVPPAVQSAFHRFLEAVPDLGFWIAHRLSGTLADHTRDPAVLDRAARAQAQYAEELLRRRPDLGLVILAHTHRAALAELGNGRAYLNPGAFLDGGRYAIVTQDAVELKTFQ